LYRGTPSYGHLVITATFFRPGKTAKKNIIDLLGLEEQARKFGLKTVKPSKNQRQNRKLFFIDPAAARSVALLRW